jgi:hypothetical protein
MSDLTLVNELRLATQTVDLPRWRAGQLFERAAATIEALQARVAEIESRPPSSPDTDEARRIAGNLTKQSQLAVFKTDGVVQLRPVAAILVDLADALDAARAECERLRAENAALRDNNDTLASLAAAARLSRGSGPGQ